MNVDLLIAWLPTIISAVIAVGIFAGRNWLKARIEGSIKHEFDQKLAVVTADLRAKEAEISALSNSVLGGRANRQALLDKRRIEAAENIWADVVALGAHKGLSATMAVLNFEALAKRAPHDAKIQQFIKTIGGKALADQLPRNADKEQLFVSPLAWAYFFAYRLIIAGAVGRAKALEAGIEDATKIFDYEYVRQLLTATLPEQADFIRKSDPAAFHYLLDGLEKKLLDELKNVIDGKDVDAAGVAQAAKIMDMVKQVNSEKAKEAAKGIPA